RRVGIDRGCNAAARATAARSIEPEASRQSARKGGSESSSVSATERRITKGTRRRAAALADPADSMSTAAAPSAARSAAALFSFEENSGLSTVTNAAGRAPAAHARATRSPDGAGASPEPSRMRDDTRMSPGESSGDAAPQTPAPTKTEMEGRERRIP